MLKKYIFIFIGLITFSFNCFAQNSKVFLRRGVYSKVTSTNQLSGKFGEIDFLFNKDIDPNNNGIINFKLVRKRISEIIPDKNATGYLCLDLEDLNYKILRETVNLGAGRWSASKLNIASYNFKRLASYVKSLRPNLKIGFFGIPLRILINNSQINDRAEAIFSPILKEVDVIFPSLYIPYVPTQVNRSKIISFINLNLSRAFTLADNLNKEVIPLMWYFTASSNKSENYIMIPKDKMEDYKNSVNAFRSTKGTKVTGIIWWDEVKSFYKSNLNKIKDNLIPQTNKKSKWSNDKTLNYYFGK